MRLNEIKNKAWDTGYVPITKDDVLTVSHGALKVNGKPFVVDYPDELITGVEDELLTTSPGPRHRTNYWYPEDIKGYYA